MSIDNSISYQQISVHFDRICVTNHFESNRGTRKPIINFELENNVIETIIKKEIKFTVNDQLSQHTQSKLKKSIRYLNYTALGCNTVVPGSSKRISFKIAFLTLTLASEQIHSDNVIKNRLLNQLFVELKKHYKVVNYVWRCEKQLNGNVHFHILVDKFIPYQELNERWNRIQNKLGYVDRYAEKMRCLTYKEYCNLFTGNKKYSKDMILKAWKKGTSQQWRYPNSTDIHSLQFIRSIDDYLIKYMTKDDQNKGISGRLWGASRELSDIKGGRAIVDSRIQYELSLIKQANVAKVIDGDYYTILLADIMLLKYIGCNTIYNMYFEFCKSHFKSIKFPET